MTVADIGDIQVAFEERGGGPAVVLVHGLAEDHRIWDRVIDDLDGYHTYALDLRGHGGSSLGDADGTLSQLAGDLLRFLETVSGSAVCVGFSLGGTVVLRAAADDDGELVRGAVVAGTSSVVGSRARDYFLERIAIAGSGDADALAAAVRDDTAAGMESADAVDAVTRRRLEAIGDAGGYRNGARAMADMHAEPLTDLLDRVAVPVRVIGANADAFCPRRAADILIDALPEAEYVEVPAAGHLMHVDNPSDLSAAIAGYLAEHGGQR